ncbi:MAG TPA: hypothetical protein VF549_15625 [Solirubrobacteraceae bacterium]|jgi:hypothetical protein
MRDAALQEEYRRLLPVLRSPRYRDAPAEDQREILWEGISRTPYATLPRLHASMIGTFLAMANKPRMKDAFHVEDDIRPPRKKLFHPFGTVGKVRLDPVPGHPYTGLFESGAVALARLSLTRDERTYAPSAAFKFFVDRRPTEQLVLDQAVDAQVSRDFFERAPTNITRWPMGFPLRYVWHLVVWWLSSIADPMHQYLDNLASVTRDGRQIPAAERRVPFRISFYAPPARHTSPESTEDFRDEVARIPEGSTLYEVYAWGGPDDVDQVHVGTVVTESSFVASDFGDHLLSLRHAHQRGAAQWGEMPRRRDLAKRS